MTTETPTPPEPLQFSLMLRKEAKEYRRPSVNKTWGTAPDEGGEQWGDRDMEKWKSLPDSPDSFAPMTDTFPVVSSRADFLNQQQMNAGFVNYFFFPEAIPVDYNRLHCDACKRLAAREARDDD